MYKKSYTIHVCNKLFILAFFLSLHGTILAQSEFEQKIASLGYDVTEVNDWSDSTDITIPTPTCAYINLSGIPGIPKKKWQGPYQGYFEVYDGNGNYFKKKILLNVVGNSTRRFDKRSFGVTFCEDDWVDGDNNTEVSIGNWIPLDGFHFKAYYSDFFRGLGTLNYKLYEQMAQSRPRPWEGASVTGKYPEKSLGHIDGFPCVVYLNGDYFGIYAWELKKNRKNMNMDKDEADHIYLDNAVTTNLSNNLTWEFEIRNPKKLYTMDGEEYDGDNPGELIDETSDFYLLESDSKKVKKAKENSAKVKASIVRFSKVDAMLKQMYRGNVGKDVIRDTLINYYDVPSLVDFWLFGLVTANYDNFNSDYQWSTYDGKVWTLTPYDLDVTYGYHNYGYYLHPPYWTSFRGPKTFAIGFTFFPYNYIGSCLKDQIKQRYAELRQNGVFTLENMMSIINDWRYRIGEDNYAREWERWPESPGILDLIPNENWIDLDDWTGYNDMEDFKKANTYYEGDTVKWNYKLWVATGTTTGVSPGLQLGCRDSLERIRNWISTRLALEDVYMDYHFESQPMAYSLEIGSMGWGTLCVPFQFPIPDGMEIYSVIGNDKGHIILNRESSVIAHKPYLVKANPGLYLLSGYSEETDEFSEDYLVNGLLRGCYVEKYVGKGNYVLQNHNGKLNFYRVEGDASVRIGKNRAYLSMVDDEANQLPFLEVDQIACVPVCDNELLGVYDANGRKLDHLTKGINIVKYKNGKTLKIVL